MITTLEDFIYSRSCYEQKKRRKRKQQDILIPMSCPRFIFSPQENEEMAWSARNLFLGVR
jgi:hypothetical protein